MTSGQAPTTFRGLSLFPFQQKAVQSVFSGHNVMVAAPTGAGKTLVADYAIEQAMGRGARVMYTSPIKALSNQKYRDFRKHYGSERVGLMTGDVTMGADAPLIIMTTEIFRNTIFEDPERLKPFDFVIFDEVHYMDDRERGTVWEEAMIYAPKHIRIVALSATIPNVDELAGWLSWVRDVKTDVILEDKRPVPLTHHVWVPGRGPKNLRGVKRHFQEMGRQRDHHNPGGRGGRGERGGGRSARRRQMHILDEASYKLLDHLERKQLLPAIYFCFSRRDCENMAERNAHRRLLKPHEIGKMEQLFDDLARRYEVSDSDDTLRLRNLARRGVLYHHAGMLPIDKEIVERLFATGLVKLLFATETFAVGVNMPARTVCFHALTKYDGISRRPMMGREYWQMAGRAGRQGIDTEGHVFSLLDDLDVSYDNIAYLHSGRAEPVRSRFNLNYSAILNLWQRLGERVPESWERSFARYQASGSKTSVSNRSSGKRKRRPRKKTKGAKPMQQGTEKIRARIRVLRDMHYLADGGWTRKGQLCARINGYEIAMTEAYEGGWLFRCDPIQAAMLVASMVYEARPSDAAERPTKSLKGIAKPFTACMATFARTEQHHGLHHTTRGPDFGMAGLVQRFAEGMSFESLADHTNMRAGDMVRVLRMTIQLLRQTAHALPKGDPCIAVLREAQNRLDRDVVDAKRQLELG